MEKFANLTDTCAFCSTPIERNYYNACDDCQEQATEDPEQFISKILN